MSQPRSMWRSVLRPKLKRHDPMLETLTAPHPVRTLAAFCFALAHSLAPSFPEQWYIFCLLPPFIPLSVRFMYEYVAGDLQLEMF